MKRKRLPPKPPSPPEGWMYWYGELTKITTVERKTRAIIGNQNAFHDDDPCTSRQSVHIQVKCASLD
jgi:hypothetical protein